MTFHQLYTDILPPDTFTDPFCYEPHPLCLMAVNDLIGRIEKPENTSNTAFLNEARQGKMFGVLVAQKPRPSASARAIGRSLFRRYSIICKPAVTSSSMSRKYPI